MRSYTAAELERETGFDRRTIAYYVHEGVLPKVGRRGSRTRYPKRIRDRLLFIRQVREAERAGTVRPVSLRELRDIFEHAPSELISRVADGRISATPGLVAAALPRLRPLEQRRAALEGRWASVKDDRTKLDSPLELGEPTVSASSPINHELSEAHYEPDRLPSRDSAAEREHPTVAEPMSDVLYQRRRAGDFELDEESEIGDLLAALQEIADRHRSPTPAMDRWLQVEVSPKITLAVRGVTDEAAFLLERAARCLQRLMLGRSESAPDDRAERP